MVVPVEAARPRLKGVVIALVGAALVYLAVLFWLDRRNQVFAQLPSLAAAMPVVLLFASLSYAIRITRFRRLLHRVGHAVPWGHCGVIYLAGFAFTASPGKLGELIRLRYLQAHGVPAATAIAEFFYERLFDLIAVLLLSTLAFGLLPGLGVAAVFVTMVASGVVALAAFPRPIQVAGHRAARHGWHKTARTLAAFGEGMQGIGTWVNLRDVSATLALSLAAWGITSLAFVWLIAQLHISIPLLVAMALTPMASLVGAASMLPGGLGSTELATATSLVVLGAPLASAALAAIGIRLGTLWFAMLLGVGALGWLETRP